MQGKDLICPSREERVKGWNHLKKKRSFEEKASCSGFLSAAKAARKKQLEGRGGENDKKGGAIMGMVTRTFGRRQTV